MVLHVKNQLNDGYWIQFCCGNKEYKLLNGEEVDIKVGDGDCMYFDIVSRTRWRNLKEEMEKETGD